MSTTKHEMKSSITKHYREGGPAGATDTESTGDDDEDDDDDDCDKDGDDEDDDEDVARHPLSLCCLLRVRAAPLYHHISCVCVLLLLKHFWTPTGQ